MFNQKLDRMAVILVQTIGTYAINSDIFVE